MDQFSSVKTASLFSEVAYRVLVGGKRNQCHDILLCVSNFVNSSVGTEHFM